MQQTVTIGIYGGHERYKFDSHLDTSPCCASYVRVHHFLQCDIDVPDHDRFTTLNLVGINTSIVQHLFCSSYFLG